MTAMGDKAQQQEQQKKKKCRQLIVYNLVYEFIRSNNTSNFWSGIE